ncbi:uncharacterized protein LOC126746251 [Anthonomus grandis grandis]|uniref:uncharacterized protein LOC126746251 n=1 Tax=Anthonomus grandis grandis TaxID=2921223 RepID=UPI002164F22B|nr:uncharacterized protein LOC126746251 [Anthonomus grandis grandis]
MQTSRQFILHMQQQTATQSRPYSLNGLFKGWSSHCCEDECRKSLEQERRAQKYVIEKSCGPSIFETWRPKVPDLTPVNFPTIQKSMMKQFGPRTCHPGMKFNAKTRCDIAKEVVEKQKMLHPKWVRSCPPIKDKTLLGPLIPNRDCVKQCEGAKGCRKKCDPKVPEGDWDPDAY